MWPDLQKKKQVIIEKLSGFEGHWKLGAKLIKPALLFCANHVLLTNFTGIFSDEG